MADFKKQGGSLTGREERYDGFEGEPRSIGSSLGHGAATGDFAREGTSGVGSTTGSHGVGHTGTDGAIGTHGHDSTHADHKKPGLMAKLNPKVDADGDGKAGFMK